MELTADFETRSACDIKTHGTIRYCQHPTTEPMCLSLAIDDNRPVVWVPNKFLGKIQVSNIEYDIITQTQAIRLLQLADKIVAQNIMFEYMMINKNLRVRSGWPHIPLYKFHDTMAQLAYHALPLNLEQASIALNLPVKKDMVGHKNMLKVCKPRAPRKKEREENPDWKNALYWWEEPHQIEKNINYCCQDVIAERLIHRYLAPLPPQERALWFHTEQKNLRGVPIDKPSAETIIKSITAQDVKQSARFQKFTRGQVSTPRSYVALKKWVNRETGLQLTSVDKDAIEKLLEKGGLPKHVEEVLKIKSELSKSSVAKFKAMLNRMDEDGRVRGWSVYHAAATGRWAAWGLQLHNNPRDSYDPNEFNAVMDLLESNNVEALSLLWDSPHYVASRCVRGAIKAPPGKEFICTDFKAIEGRGLAHLAGEKWVVDAYRQDEDLYKIAASTIFGVPKEEIDGKQRNVGKVSELAFGYGGGIGAYASMAKGYKLDLETLPLLILPTATPEELDGPYGAKALANMFLADNRGRMSLEAAISCDIIKQRWRMVRPEILRFWREIENCAIEAIKTPGRVVEYRNIRYCVHRGFLKCLLPSGRVLHYFQPQLSRKIADWRESLAISYMGMKIVDGQTTRKWVRLFTFKGKLVENITQAFCRDILGAAMLRLEKKGYPVILDVHDEILTEVNAGEGSLEEFNKIASVVPKWAEGMPIGAEGWRGIRYRKE